MNIYALTEAGERHHFFSDVFLFVDDNKKCFLLGDFNSVENGCDRLSGRLDGTSVLLSELLADHRFLEPQGSHRDSYTYHHPSIPERKSQLDRIYMNFSGSTLRGYCAHIPCSNHYLVGISSMPDHSVGPKMWCFSLICCVIMLFYNK